MADALLWLFVITFSLQMGAGLYEMRVVTPLWSNSPPESVHEWNVETRYTILPRESFWRYCTPAVGLTAIGALISGWGLRGKRRKWLLLATLPVIAMVFVTYAYFAPTLAEMLGKGGEGLSDQQLIEKVNQWLALSRLRAAVYTFAWLSALRALSIPATLQKVVEEKV